MRVMIVEDDAAARERFAAALSADSRIKAVEQIASGREAMARMAIAKPDVLLVDLGLPDMHGSKVIQHAAQVCPQCDCMVITVFGDDHNVFSSIEAGANGYVLKDCEPKALVEHVIELREGGAPMSPAIARMVLGRMHRSQGADAALTAREIEILNLLSRGYSYTEAAEQLGLSAHTVATHVKNTYRKLAVHNAAAAVARAAELNLIRPK